MYSVLDYGRMAADPVRMGAYARAIERVVEPGSVVIDLGAGTGILSILAARAGAKRVHAIEPNPAVWLIPDLAAENGVADRITIHHTTSDAVALEERADVVISDLRGILPLHGDAANALRDAHDRLVAPGGVVLPGRERLHVALVDSEGMWQSLARSWECFARVGLTSGAARRSILNTPHNDRAAPIGESDVVSDTKCWNALDYATFDGSALEGTVELMATRSGKAHGLVVWFDTSLGSDIGFSTAPGSSMIYSRLFLPLLDPIAIAVGDRVEVTVRADARGERWAWDTTSRHGRVRQSTFLGVPTAPDALLRESSAHRPTTTDQGARVRTLLEKMDGSSTVEELARVFEGALPEGSPLRRRALDEVRDVVNRYAR